ncbi:hypothetical protein LXL04_017633 [Taraxacum kok-saghyz]
MEANVAASPATKHIIRFFATLTKYERLLPRFLLRSTSPSCFSSPIYPNFAEQSTYEVSEVAEKAHRRYLKLTGGPYGQNQALSSNQKRDFQSVMTKDSDENFAIALRPEKGLDKLPLRRHPENVVNVDQGVTFSKLDKKNQQLMVLNAKIWSKGSKRK